MKRRLAATVVADSQPVDAVNALSPITLAERGFPRVPRFPGFRE